MYVNIVSCRTSGNFKNEMELGVRGTSVQGFDNPVYDSPLPFEDSFIVTYDPHNDQVRLFSILWSYGL